MSDNVNTTEAREILVILKGGKRRRVSNIPANAKITYGPVSPGSRYPDEQQNALRIYTSQQNQLAVFVGVEKFRDLSIVVQEQKALPRVRNSPTGGSNGRTAAHEFDKTDNWAAV
jgi:hypothetical protein